MSLGSWKPSHTHQEKPGGFTLTETVVVVILAGVILSAIWVVAGTVYLNTRIAKAKDEILAIAENVRAVYALSPTADPALDMLVFGPPSGTALNYVRLGVFPSNMLNGVASTATVVRNPWGGDVSIVGAQRLIANDSFQVAFDGIPQDACMMMIAALTGPDRDYGLIGIATARQGSVPQPLTSVVMPVPASTARTSLCTPGLQALGFTFTLR